MSAVDTLKTLIKDFEAAQRKYKKYGAQDTEPDGYFQVLMYRAANGNLGAFPTNPDNWELYHMPGMNAAAAGLYAAARKVTDFIGSVPLSEAGPVRGYVLSYCWRVG